jgi:cytoskeletal protein CcmA (bactofilin family)/ribosomal protein L40E
MAAIKPERLIVSCPRCGSTQPEPRAVVSTVCRQCQTHIQVRGPDPLAPSAPYADPARPGRHVSCFRCGTPLEVPPTAESTMCKRCSDYVDLRDYLINSAVSKNFRTHGRFVVEEKGYVFNTECVVAEAVIRGRFLGKLHARDRLEIHPGAKFEGSFQTGLLVIPVGRVFHWPGRLELGGAEIHGELVADVQVTGTLTLKASARCFGDVRAANLVVEPGAVVVGDLRVGAGLPS